MKSKTLHMSPEEFKANGYAFIDWIAKYYEEVGAYPVMSQVSPGDVAAQLPEEPPEHGEPMDAVLRDMSEIIVPGLTHWASPNFFAYFPSNASPPSVLGDLLSSGLGTQGMLWATSPAATELETRVMDWLATLLDLPAVFRSTGMGGGVIQDSASSATLSAILAARERCTQGKTNAEGVGYHGTLVAYSSEHAHSSIEKGIRIAGIGSKNLRKVPTLSAHQMDVSALQGMVKEDIARGCIPFFVSATVGSTASGAFDDIEALAKVCAAHDIWLHVDAAMYGTAAACPEFRWIHSGLDLAQSYCFNPHKWMLTNFDCCAFWVADRRDLIGALGIHPDYLQNRATDSGTVIDYRDWQIPLGRRFRALKLWCVLRAYGTRKIREMIRHHVSMTQRFASWVEAHPRFELCAPHPFNLVCFRLKGSDADNRALMDRLNDSGQLYLSHCVLHGRFTIRLCVGQWSTEIQHVQKAWSEILGSID